VKMKIRTALLLVVIPSAFVATSCAPSATSDGRAADASAIQALDEQWSATAARNDLEGTVAFYANDAVLLIPGSAPGRLSPARVFRQRKTARKPARRSPNARLSDIGHKRANSFNERLSLQ
jgi:hypothetical protein